MAFVNAANQSDLSAVIKAVNKVQTDVSMSLVYWRRNLPLKHIGGKYFVHPDYILSTAEIH